MGQKRVLCIIENLSQGGAERQMIGLASMLAKDGNKVQIIIYDADLFYLPLLKDTGVNCIYLEKAKNKLLRIPIVTKYIKHYNPDTVIAFLNTPSIIACLAKIVLKKFKLIVSERNTNLRLELRDRIKFMLYKYADYIVPNSYSQTEYIKAHYPRLQKKLVTITNFSDTNYFSPIQRDYNTEVLKISCVGRICEQKNIKRFIHAIKQVVDEGISLRVDWYGLAFQPYADECVNLLKHLELEDVFRFHKETSNVRSVYYHSDVLILPSIYEGYPNVVCEAISCGLPVLCSNVCDNPIIVRDGDNGFLFNPHSVSEMSSTIIRFAKLSSEKRKEMGKRSREIALANFSMDKFFEKYKKLIFEK